MDVMGKLLRLDKYLSDMNIGSRSEIKSWIRKGRVCKNSLPCYKPEEKVRINDDEITFDGQRIIYEEFIYFILNKPAGVVSATEDKRDKTVIDLIETVKRKDLFPVGRLDKDTEGLLILTNDGDLAHRLLSPKKEVDKVYYAKINGRVTDGDVASFLSGISIGEDKPCLPAKLNILKSDEISEVNVTIYEGKYHQVKRMFEAVGKEVIYLKRISMGGLSLDPLLKPGDYRRLTIDELKNLNNIRLQKKE
ncbi:MAG: rRNA pseudouridine synthase [Anaerolineaceae bacterium]|nr:MAG: rRNA pseudouridine synthase [Anaerolineaceae bacterium]